MMLNRKSSNEQGLNSGRTNHRIVCSWCGAVIRTNAEANEEQMCLICHARMLNDYFQKMKKVSDERRASRRF